MGLPLSLEGVGAVLGLEKQKLTEGKELIRYFCQPCSPTKSNGQRTRNFPHHAPDKWRLFKKYNIRDVETEMAIQARLVKYPVPDFVWEEYHIDQVINDRGVALDMELVQQAIAMDSRSRAELTTAMKEITELENPNSVQQMKQWLSDNGLKTDTLGKKAVTDLMKTAPPKLQNVLTLRQQLAKSSVKKYQSMETAVCSDGRARGMFQFYGANRTGRWAGRIIQMQNLPQNHSDELAQARDLVRGGDFDAVQMLYEDVPDTLSQLIRTAFIPKEGCKFIVADFSAIEARVIAWLAGEKWRQKVFADGGDIYCASASQMFGVPVEKHGVNGHLRQKGKIAELALGYGGSVGALKAMGAIDMGLTEDELPELVSAWRQTNPHIVKLWWDIDRAVKDAVIKKTTTDNSLTSIAQLCEKNPSKAKKATIEFSEYLRRNMNSLKEQAPVPFESELKHLETYLSLEKMRFGDELNIEYDIETTDFLIPSLTVQPLVENAVKHGVGMKEDGGTVTIATKEFDDRYEVIVSDDGVGFDTAKKPNDGRTHIGMENVRNRLKTMCNAVLNIESTVGKGTVATITIPKEEI